MHTRNDRHEIAEVAPEDRGIVVEKNRVDRKRVDELRHHGGGVVAQPQVFASGDELQNPE